jgi:hypothetical protein
VTAPVRRSDVLAVLPAFVRRSDSAPVRDALAAALVEILSRYRQLSAYAAAQCDITRATGIYLQSLCAEHGVFKQDGESDDALRVRALTAPNLVTPTAILAAANAILALYTSARAQYAESALDRWFVQDGSAGWHSFVGAQPQYLARLYPADAAANGGFVRPSSEIGGAWAFADQLGRFFILRVPVLTGLGSAHAFLAADITAPVDARSFVADGSNAGGSEASGQVAMFVYADPSTALAAYQAIVNAVTRIKGQSVRWAMVADPRLGS